MTAPRTLTYNGLTLTHDEWADRYGLTTRSLRFRLDAGWPIERALNEPLSNRGRPRRPTPTALMQQLPALQDWQRDMHAAHRQMTRSVRAFVRQMEEQMAELRHSLDQQLAAQREEANRNIIASHTRGVRESTSKIIRDRCSRVTQEIV